MNGNPEIIEQKENYLLGALGALLFALSGGIIWFLLYQVGYLAGISGLIGVICAIKGYKLFAKKESLAGVIISVVAAILVMIVAAYFCLSMDVYQAYQEWYANGEVNFTITFTEAVMNAHLFLQDGSFLLRRVSCEGKLAILVARDGTAEILDREKLQTKYQLIGYVTNLSSDHP